MAGYGPTLICTPEAQTNGERGKTEKKKKQFPFQYPVKKLGISMQI